jgi:hypothetical protein
VGGAGYRGDAGGTEHELGGHGESDLGVGTKFGPFTSTW